MIGSFKFLECFALCPRQNGLSRWPTDPRGRPCRSSPSSTTLSPPSALPTSALSGPDGQIRPVGVQGVFHADVRVLDRAVLRVDDREPEAVAHAPGRPRRDVVRRAGPLARRPRAGPDGPGDPHPADGARRPRGDGHRVVDRVRAGHVHGDAWRSGCDLAAVEVVKSGPAPSRPVGRSRCARGATAGAGPAAGPLSSSTGERRRGGRAAAWLRWPVALAPGGSVELRWRVKVDGHRGPWYASAAARRRVGAPRGGAPTTGGWPGCCRPLPGRPRVAAPAADRRPGRHLRRAPGCPGSSPSSAATACGRRGCCCRWAPTSRPGRCGCWRAGRAGRSTRRTGEEPGKILHELRRHDVRSRTRRRTAPVRLLRLGRRHAAVDLPAARRVALGHAAGAGRRRCCRAWRRRWSWLGDLRRRRRRRLRRVRRPQRPRAGQPGLEGLGRLGALPRRPARGAADRAGRGAGVRPRGGARTAPPCWTPSAGRAPTGGASYAADLAERFRDRLLGRRPGRHPSGAGAGRRQAAGRLADQQHRPPARHRPADARRRRPWWPTCSARRRWPAGSGCGRCRRTTPRSARCPTTAGRCGRTTPRSSSTGLARAGFTAPAATLAEGLLAAAEAFDYRLPELFGGDDRAAARAPGALPRRLPPAGLVGRGRRSRCCTPRWALRPDVPAGTVTVAPLAGAPLGAVSVAGLRVAGEPVTVSVDATGAASVTGLPASLVAP